MPGALFKGAVLADSELCHIAEGNYYFPPDAVDHRYLRPGGTHTGCGWKGVASYYHVDVDGEVNIDAAGFHPILYPPPSTSRTTTSLYLKFVFQRSDDGSVRRC